MVFEKDIEGHASPHTVLGGKNGQVHESYSSEKTSKNREGGDVKEG